MILYWLLGFYVIGFILLVFSLMRSAPVGYEDEEGFHLEEQNK